MLKRRKIETQRSQLELLPRNVIESIAQYLLDDDNFLELLVIARCASREPSRLYHILVDAFVSLNVIYIHKTTLQRHDWAPNMLVSKARSIYSCLRTTDELQTLLRLFPHVRKLYLSKFNDKLPPGIFPEYMQNLYFYVFERDLHAGSLPRRIGGSLRLEQFDGELVAGVLPNEIGGFLDLDCFNSKLGPNALPRVIGGSFFFDSFNKELCAGALPRRIGGDFHLHSFNGKFPSDFISIEVGRKLYLYDFKGYFPPSRIKVLHYRGTKYLLDEKQRQCGFTLPFKAP